MASPTFASLRNDIRHRSLQLVYILAGQEGYYADRLIEAFEGVIDEADRDFNLFVIYGSQQLDVANVVETARRYPMMSDRQVVILKEAQTMRADQLDKLAGYILSPSPTTVLVICFRGDKPKGKAMMDAAKKGAVIFTSERPKPKDLPQCIKAIVDEHGLAIEVKALTMLKDYLGADLSKVHNAVAKLAMVLPPKATVTPEAIERNIGISKDFNSYELTDAIISRNFRKSMQIVEYFKANPKSNPPQAVASSVFNLFSNLLVYHFTPDKSPASLMAAMGFSQSWQLRNYETAARNFNAFQTAEIVSAIRDFDVKSKGIGSRQDASEMLRDLIYRIFTARGVLPS